MRHAKEDASDWRDKLLFGGRNSFGEMGGLGVVESVYSATSNDEVPFIDLWPKQSPVFTTRSCWEEAKDKTTTELNCYTTEVIRIHTFHNQL